MELWEHAEAPFAPVTVQSLATYHVQLLNPALTLFVVPLGDYNVPRNMYNSPFTVWQSFLKYQDLSTKRIALLFTHFDTMARMLPFNPPSKQWPTCTGAFSRFGLR